MASAETIAKAAPTPKLNTPPQTPNQLVGSTIISADRVQQLLDILNRAVLTTSDPALVQETSKLAEFGADDEK